MCAPIVQREMNGIPSHGFPDLEPLLGTVWIGHLYPAALQPDQLGMQIGGAAGACTGVTSGPGLRGPLILRIAIERAAWRGRGKIWPLEPIGNGPGAPLRFIKPEGAIAGATWNGEHIATWGDTDFIRIHRGYLSCLVGFGVPYMGHQEMESSRIVRPGFNLGAHLGRQFPLEPGMAVPVRLAIVHVAGIRIEAGSIEATARPVVV